MTEPNVAAIVNEIAAECGEDYVGLWIIPKKLSQAGQTESMLVEKTLLVLKNVAAMREIIFGEFVDSHFMAWDLPLDAALRKIESGWQSLGRTPDVGEIAWITAR